MSVTAYTAPQEPSIPTQEKEPISEWRDRFENDFTVNGEGAILADRNDASDIKDFIREVLLSERTRMAEEIEAMFSVYPAGGIHDFDEDEELISKKKAIDIINKRK